MSFLKTKKTAIVNADDKKVYLRGVNLGGWLMMEGYIMHALNLPAAKFKNEFAQAHGSAGLREFEEAFTSHFITERDIQNIAAQGFTCVRLPFHHKVVESSPRAFQGSDIRFIDQTIEWAKRYKIYVILDLHAAPGSQNHDWHSDSFGQAEFWTNEDNRQRVYALWEFLADRYKNEPAVAGYDLLNESVLTDSALLNDFYKTAIQTIRKVDRNHILFIEGNTWAQDIECLDRFDDGNYALSIHYYGPLEFTFNLVPFLSYPLKSPMGTFDHRTIVSKFIEYKLVSEERGVPLFLGEFGVNYRQGLGNEERWVKDVLKICSEFGFHWTYWTYKAVKNAHHPDGIYSYIPNPPWVNRQGPKLGWDTWRDHWTARKHEMIQSWRTQEFTENSKILAVLKHGI